MELEVANYRLSSRQVQLPPELLNITDDELRKRISSRIRTPAGELGKFKIRVETSNGTMVLEIDERWLTTERKRIEDLYTFTIPRFGRVILNTQRKCFDEEIARYRETVLAYQQAVVGELDKVKSNFVKKLVERVPSQMANRIRPRTSLDTCPSQPKRTLSSTSAMSPNGCSPTQSISRPHRYA